MQCSICSRRFEPAQSTALPFCSERCQLIDLGRWLDEGYGMPAELDAGAEDLPELPEASPER
jgi:endogenous inhibitor of DNA gyrase (YacG/DUF329 family)